MKVIDWRKIAILEPIARIPELHFLLRSFTDADLFSFQRQGMMIFKVRFVEIHIILIKIIIYCYCIIELLCDQTLGHSDCIGSGQGTPSPSPSCGH